MQDLHRQFLAYLLTYPQGFAQLLSEKGACVTVMPSCCLIHAMYYVELATNVANRVEIIHPSHTTVRTVRYTAVQFLGQIIFS